MGEAVVDLVGEPAVQHDEARELAQQDGAGGQKAGDQDEAEAQGVRAREAGPPHRVAAFVSSRGSRRQ